MSVQFTVLGSGDAFNSGGRANASYLVQDARGAFCVDFGPTSLLRLKTLGISTNAIDTIFFTHLHGDHFGGIHLFLIDADYCAQREAPLVIAGPRGTREHVTRWCELAFGAPPPGRRFGLRFVEFDPRETRCLDGRRVTAFQARHMGEGDRPLAYRFDLDGARLAFSGDTAWTGDLSALAKGTDLFVCDCTNLSGAGGQHLTWSELRPHLPELETKMLLLSHLGEDVRPPLPGLDEKTLPSNRPPMLLCADDGWSRRIGG